MALVATMSLPQQMKLTNVASQETFNLSGMVRWGDVLKKTGRVALAAAAAASMVFVSSTNALAADETSPMDRFTDEQIAEFMKNRESYDVMQVRKYLMVDGPGQGHKCPNMKDSADGFTMTPGSYTVVNMCLEPATYTVKRTYPLNPKLYFQTKFVPNYFSSFQGIEGSLDVTDDGKLTFRGSSTDDESTITLLLPNGGERVKYAYALKDVVADGEKGSFSGKFSTLPLKDQFEDKNAGIAPLPGDSAVFKDNKAIVLKEEMDLGPTPSGGEIVFRVIKSNPETGEVMGEFESDQITPKEWVGTPYSGLTIRTHGHKKVTTQGTWYAMLQR